MATDAARHAAAEALGTAFLLTAIVGSGIMGERLAGGNVAVALLANSLATGGALVALIATLQPVSGAHFNPVVTVVDAVIGATPWARVPLVIAAQVTGAVVGVLTAHAMFGEAWLGASTHDRGGLAQLLSESVATFGLLAVVIGGSRRAPALLPFAVSAYIASAYWFTASTSFANPAVTLARSLTGTFAGVRSIDVPGFVVAQVLGGLTAAIVVGWLVPKASAGT